MTWEETIYYIRKQSQYKSLVEQAYLDENLDLNLERYLNGKEFKRILEIIKEYAPNSKNILDIGSGNGISAISFALHGFNVTAVEPDSSDTIGAGAIRKLIENNKLTNVTVVEAYAEDAGFEKNQFDIVFCRQSMHHANNLNDFVSNITSCLKPGGLFLSVRDHVVFNEREKVVFLETHPLHKFYGGENAYSDKEYRRAIKKADLTLIKELKYYDDIINYFPQPDSELQQMIQYREELVKYKARKIPFLSFVFLPIIRGVVHLIKGPALDESIIPGRMYSYISIKKQ